MTHQTLMNCVPTYAGVFVPCRGIHSPLQGHVPPHPPREELTSTPLPQTTPRAWDASLALCLCKLVAAPFNVFYASEGNCISLRGPSPFSAFSCGPPITRSHRAHLVSPDSSPRQGLSSPVSPPGPGIRATQKAP